MLVCVKSLLLWQFFRNNLTLPNFIFIALQKPSFKIFELHTKNKNKNKELKMIVQIKQAKKFYINLNFTCFLQGSIF